jgi:Arc/MetJ-type ribon-helix-helix transcriptional regulator
MKRKLSISVDEATLQKIEKALSNGAFRNTSHVFEHAVNKMLSESEEE